MERKVVGFGRQTLILLWKNGLLFRRNILGTFMEIIISLINVFVLLIIRYVVDVRKYATQDNFGIPLIYLMSISKQKKTVLFSPNNAYIKMIVENAFNIIKKAKPNYNFNITPSNFNDVNSLLLLRVYY